MWLSISSVTIGPTWDLCGPILINGQEKIATTVFPTIVGVVPMMRSIDEPF